MQKKVLAICMVLLSVLLTANEEAATFKQDRQKQFEKRKEYEQHLSKRQTLKKEQGALEHKAYQMKKRQYPRGTIATH